MSHITVRQAVLSDIQNIVPLFDAYRQSYGRASDASAAHEFLLARISKGESAMFIASIDDVAVGLTQMYPFHSAVALDRIFVLNDLFVLKQARNQGVASKLVSTAIAYAKAMGAVRLSLVTENADLTAKALSNSFGWVLNQEFSIIHFPITS